MGWCICGPTRRALKTRSQSGVNYYYYYFFLFVLLSALVERFGVSRMRDFLSYNLSKIVSVLLSASVESVGVSRKRDFADIFTFFFSFFEGDEPFLFGGDPTKKIIGGSKKDFFYFFGGLQHNFFWRGEGGPN